MSEKIIENPVRPVVVIPPIWWAAINVAFSLVGILFLGWSLSALIYLFWIEVFLTLAFALVRALLAMDGQPFFATLFSKLFMLVVAGVLSIAFFLLTVTFTFDAFYQDGKMGEFRNIGWQLIILFVNYLMAMLLHYLFNGKYKTASPMIEAMRPFVRMLFLLCLLMVVTQFILPKFPNLASATWTAAAILILKFLADWLFGWGERKLLDEVENQQYKKEAIFRNGGK
jgi:hypothetical protein